MTFDKKANMVKMQGGRTYLLVSARIVWFRQEHPNWRIQTEIVTIDHEQQWAIFRAKIIDADGHILATGTKKEDVKGFGDFIEKAETGSVGRALSFLGYGTEGEGNEREADRPVDSPEPVETETTPQAARPQQQRSGQAQDPQEKPHHGAAAFENTDKMTPAQARELSANLLSTFDKAALHDWKLWLHETYGSDDVRKISDANILLVYAEISDAVAEANAEPEQEEQKPQANPR